MLNAIYEFVVSSVPWIQSEFFWVPLACVVLVWVVHFTRYIIEGGLNYNG